MQSVDERIRSFAAITKPKSAARPGWPLDPKEFPLLTPKRLAESGWYYAPQPSGIDTCNCFFCGHSLVGWEETDDPIEEHWKRREHCAWAEFACAMLREKRDGIYPATVPTAEALPQSAESIALRRMTFGNSGKGEWWPHEHKKGWRSTSANLAAAGFIFAPGDDAEDATICTLCSYAVEGWEKTDDPWKIHHDKKPNCRFFTMTVDAPAKKGKKRATQARARQTTVAASDRDDAEGSDLPNPQAGAPAPTPKRRAPKARGTMTTAASNATAPSRSTRATTAAPPRRKTARAGTAADSEVGDSGTEAPSEADNDASQLPEKAGTKILKGKKAPVTKKAGGRKKAAELEEDASQQEETEGGADSDAVVAAEDDVDQQPTPKAASRARKPRATTRTAAKPRATKVGAKGRGKGRAKAADEDEVVDLTASEAEAEADGEQLHGAACDIEAEDDREKTPQPSKPSRSKSSARSRATTASYATAPTGSESTRPKPAAGTVAESESDQQPQDLPSDAEAVSVPATRKTAARKTAAATRRETKSASSRRQTKKAPVDEEVEGAEDEEVDMDVDEEEEEPSRSKSSKTASATSKTAKSRSKRIAKEAETEADTQAEDDEQSVAQAVEPAAVAAEEEEEEEVSSRPSSRLGKTATAKSAPSRLQVQSGNASRSTAPKASRGSVMKPALAQKAHIEEEKREEGEEGAEEQDDLPEVAEKSSTSRPPSAAASRSRSSTSTAVLPPKTSGSTSKSKAGNKGKAKAASDAESSRPPSAASATSGHSEAEQRSVPTALAKGSAASRKTAVSASAPTPLAVAPSSPAAVARPPSRAGAASKSAPTRQPVAGRTAAVRREEEDVQSAPTGGRAIKPKPRAKAPSTARQIEKPLPTLPSSSSGRITPTNASLPSLSAAQVQIPLSQLTHFANIPPTSPISPGPVSGPGAGHSRQASEGKSLPVRTAPGGTQGKGEQVGPAVRSAPARQKGVDVEQHQSSVRAGAEASRGLVESVIRTVLSPPAGSTAPSSSGTARAPVPATSSVMSEEAQAKATRHVRPFPPDNVVRDDHVQLSEQELDMTVEQYLLALYEAKRQAMKEDGERMIREWSEEAASQRKRVVAKHFA